MKPHVTTNEGTRGLLAGIVQAMSAFLKDLRSREPNFSRKSYIAPVTKPFCPFVLVLSNVTNLKGKFVRVQNVF